MKSRSLLLLTAILGLFCLAHDATAQRVALLIGNSDYSAPDMDLRNPVNDVTALAAALEGLDFDVSQITDQDAPAMTAALQQFEQDATGAEMAVFFYAGHGVQIGNENHLIGTEFGGGDLGALRRASLSVSDVRSMMTRAAPEIGMVILDACRNNPFTAKGLVRPGLVRQAGGAGLLIAYATDPGNVAYDGLGANSVFTKALLAHIDTPGLDARLMLGRVRQQVVLDTAGRQVPWVEEAVLGEHSFAPARIVPDADVQTAEMVAWRAIARSENAEDFKGFLETYPGGVFEVFAQDRIVALQTRPTQAGPKGVEAVLAEADPDQLAAALRALGLPVGDTPSRGLRIYQQRLPDPTTLSTAQLYDDAAQVSMFLAATTLQQLRTDLIALRSIQRTLTISEDALSQMQEIAKTNAAAAPLVTQARQDINAIRRARGVVLRRLDQSRTYYDEILDQSSVFFPDDATLALLGSVDATRGLAGAGQKINENASVFLRHLAQAENTTKGSYQWLADLLSLE